jgi:hypothetical protein
MLQRSILILLQGTMMEMVCQQIKDIKYSSTSKKLIKTLQTLTIKFRYRLTIKKEVQKN